MILIPTPLAEISARSGRGRNCGTLYAHIRALRPAVRRPAGQSGLLIDADELRSIATATPLAPRQLPSDTGPAKRSIGPTPITSDLPASADGTASGDVRELIGVVRDLVGLVHRLLDAQDATAATPAEHHPSLLHVVADGPRRPVGLVHDVADRPRPTDRREGGRDTRKTPGKTLPPSPHPIRDARETGAVAGVDVADARLTEPNTGASRPDSQLLELVGPLIRLAERTNLVGLTDLHRLTEALGPYSDQQIRHAVEKTAALARNGTVSSPIGWLITKAGQGDPLYYPPPSPQPTPRDHEPAADTVRSVVEPTDADAEAEAEVTTMEADPEAHRDALAELDRSIRASGPAGKRILADTHMRHDARVQHWRIAHPIPRAPRRSPT